MFKFCIGAGTKPKFAWCEANIESEKAPQVHVQHSGPRTLSNKQSGAAKLPSRVTGIVIIGLYTIIIPVITSACTGVMMQREQSAQEKTPPQNEESNKQSEQKELNVRGE